MSLRGWLRKRGLLGRRSRAEESPRYSARAYTGPRPWTLAWLWQEFLYTFLPAYIAVALISHYVVQGIHVYGASMEPALYENDRIVVDKVTYRFRPPRRGEIVILHVWQYREDLLKRVVGLPGEEIAIHDGRVYVNGQPLNEPYLREPTPGEVPPTRIPPMHYFVLGDNRDASGDSRYFGPVPRSAIIGRVIFRYWPPERIGPVH